MGPANLNKLSPADPTPRYAETMEGSDKVLVLAQRTFDGDVFFGSVQMVEDFIFWFNVATPQYPYKNECSCKKRDLVVAYRASFYS